MSNPFSLTLRSVQADGLRRVGLMAALGISLLLAWGAWFLAADLTIYARSQSARLEASERPSPLLSERGGRVAAVLAQVGETVEEGQVIIEIDAEMALLELDEARATEAGLSVRLDALRRALASSSGASTSAASASRSAMAAVDASAEAAHARAQLARAEAARADRLFAEGHLSRAEHEAILTGARAREAEARELSNVAAQVRAGGAQASQDRDANLAARQGELDALESELEAAWARVSRLELALERTQIRATTSGHLAELDALSVGAWIEPGVTLGTIVPDSALEIVADFAPVDALGRVAPGQRARMRLDGFPWTRYGTLAAEVVRVSEEPRDGRVRVVLAPEAGADSRLPLRHALTGSVEIAVDELSPADLALRVAGRALSAPASEAR